MANLAQEEADRFFSSSREAYTSHPEDRDDRSGHSSDQGDESANGYVHSDAGTDDDDDNHPQQRNMTSLMSAKTTYHLPTTAHYANTGPKGVIADAQSFARAKQSTLRQRLASFANNLTSVKPPAAARAVSEKQREKDSSDSEDLTLSDEEADSEFMDTWRARRLQELSTQSQSIYSSGQRKNSPSRRMWGSLIEVDAVGYLDAVEKVSPDTVVVVMIYDPASSQSAEVEYELAALADKYLTTRFVRLHHEIAEMEAVEIPAVLAYRAGDVFATLSGARAEGLESTLIK